MNLNVEPHHLARVTFRAQILLRYDVGRVQTPEFQNYVQVMFRPIIRTDKKYVERQYSIFITLCVFFHKYKRFPQIDALRHDFRLMARVIMQGRTWQRYDVG